MKRIVFYSFSILCLSFFLCNRIVAEEIADSEYARLAMKFYDYERGNENDSLIREQIKSFYISRNLDNFIQSHEYAISQDDNHQTYIRKILIIVKKNIYLAMSSYIIRYAHDLHNAFGCAIDIVSVSGESVSQIKLLLQTYSTDLNGAVFIGDIVPAYYYHSAAPSWSEETFPCDLFYMDLNGTWSLKNDGTGVYDNHTGDVKPEIFLGRINTANMGRDEVQELKYYFDKNHKYWIGEKPLNKKRALTFTETDWDYSTFWNSVAPLYGNNYYDIVKANMFYKSDYLNYLQNNNYEFIQLACHSGYNTHYFEVGGVHSTVFNYEISALNKKQIGYNLFCCKACKWTESSTSLCLGESYLYGQNNNSSTLTLVGSTKTGSMLGFDDFYTPLGNGKCIGEAFKSWWINHCGTSHTIEQKRWFYGMTILGDPLVNFNYTNECDDILVLNIGEEPTNNIYYAQTKIIVQNYSLTQGQSVTLAAPTIQISGNFICTSPTVFSTNINNQCFCNATKKMPQLMETKVSSHNVCSIPFYIYPNPVSDILYIETSEQLSQINIYNLQGKCLLQTTDLQVNVAQFPIGFYVLSITTKDGHYYQSKFLKQ